MLGLRILAKCSEWPIWVRTRHHAPCLSGRTAFNQSCMQPTHEPVAAFRKSVRGSERRLRRLPAGRAKETRMTGIV